MDNSTQRQIVQMWSNGVSVSEIAFVFGVSRYEVKKAVRAQAGYDIAKQIHSANNRNLNNHRLAKVRQRLFEHPNQSRQAALFYVRHHEALGRRARYNPDEYERLKRILDREGSP
jgi:transposase